MRGDSVGRGDVKQSGDTKRDCKWTLLFIFKKQSQRTPVINE